ncbi:MAG: hypothetical protein M3220_12350 [Chloroflexota bacterium]|nr:hypothetical protein [Chloroflexota bacterium]
MIQNDPYTALAIIVLILLGFLGLLLPRWFIIISRFPFIFLPNHHPPIDDAARRRARIWGAISILGALFLIWFIY